MTRQAIRTSAGMVLFAGFLVLFIGGGGRFVIGLTLKSMVEDLDSGRAEIGLAVALFMVVSALATFVAGRMADRMSLRTLLIAGLAISGIGVGLTGLITAPWHALVLYGICFAIGNGMASTPPVGVMVTRAYPGRVGLANAVALSGMSAGQLMMVAVLAGVLVAIGWRSVFFWVGAAHIVLLPLLFFAIPGKRGSHEGRAQNAAPPAGASLREAARTRPFWVLMTIYAVCGFDDFFVATHVVAFAQDKGVDTLLAGNLLAAMGLTALIGVLVSGTWSDRAGPVWPTVAAFGARVAIFALIAVDQSPLSIAIFALVFGLTFTATAPLCIVFSRTFFGMVHLGSISGLITMVHQIAGGLGAYAGASIFDLTGRYDLAFLIMFGLTAAALLLTLSLRRAPRYDGSAAAGRQ